MKQRKRSLTDRIDTTAVHGKNETDVLRFFGKAYSLINIGTMCQRKNNSARPHLHQKLKSVSNQHHTPHAPHAHSYVRALPLDSPQISPYPIQVDTPPASSLPCAERATTPTPARLLHRGHSHATRLQQGLRYCRTTQPGSDNPAFFARSCATAVLSFGFFCLYLP